MKRFVNILALLIFGTLLVVLNSSSDQQTAKPTKAHHIVTELSESFPSSLLNVIASRQNSSTPTVRRIHPESKHSRLYGGAMSLNIAIQRVDINFFYNFIQQTSLSLVFRLRNIRI